MIAAHSPGTAALRHPLRTDRSRTPQHQIGDRSPTRASSPGTPPREGLAPPGRNILPGRPKPQTAKGWRPAPDTEAWPPERSRLGQSLSRCNSGSPHRTWHTLGLTCGAAVCSLCTIGGATPSHHAEAS
eukprot:8948301-Alexandrium_andersonii.AAC.1